MRADTGGGRNRKFQRNAAARLSDAVAGAATRNDGLLPTELLVPHEADT